MPNPLRKANKHCLLVVASFPGTILQIARVLGRFRPTTLFFDRLHTREVAGSKPAVPMNSPVKQLVRPRAAPRAPRSWSPEAFRTRYLRSYVQAILARDLPEIGGV